MPNTILITGAAGIFEGTPREKVREQFDVNLFGAMDVIRAVLPHLRADRAGAIVNISSGAATSPPKTSSRWWRCGARRRKRSMSPICAGASLRSWRGTAR
jgi:NAD(P)-dependent dehydrogenase (short-subunit alcohol dehydrogenase family)